MGVFLTCASGLVRPPFRCVFTAHATGLLHCLVHSLTQRPVLPLPLSSCIPQVRDEQYRLRPNPEEKVTGDMLNEMHYTRQVVKEILRFRPAAPMVPMRAKAPFKLTETYTAPKGALIVPSLVAACKQVGAGAGCCTILRGAVWKDLEQV